MKKIVALLLVTVFVALSLVSCGAKSALDKEYTYDSVSISFTKEGKDKLKDKNLTKDDVIGTLEAIYKVTYKEVKFDDKDWDADGSELVPTGVGVKVAFAGKTVKASGSKVKISFEGDYGEVTVTLKQK